MKRFMILAVVLFAANINAQSIPTLAKPVTLAGAQGMNAALATKADVTGGALSSPTITGGILSSTKISGSGISGSTMDSSNISASSISSDTTAYGPIHAQVPYSSLSTALDVTPQMFGDVPGSTTDDTTYIQDAINFICSQSSSGGVLRLPPATYQVTTVTIPCGGVYIEGSGIGSGGYYSASPSSSAYYGSIVNTISGASSGSAVFYFHASSQNYIYGGGISGISFKNTGSVIIPEIEADFFRNFKVSNIYSYGAMGVIRLISGAGNKIEHITADGVLPGGIAIELSASGSSASSTGQFTRMDTPVMNDVYISMGAPSGATGLRHATGIYIHGFVATPQARNVEVVNPYYGVLVDCTVDGSNIEASDIGECPQFIDFSDVEIDFADSANFRLLDFTYFKCRGCYAHGNSSTIDNVQLYSPNFISYGAEIFGGKFDSSQYSCIASEVAGTRVIGVDVYGCNSGSTGSASIQFGVDTKTPNKIHSAVSSSTFCNYSGSSKTSAAAILVDYTLSYFSATGNVYDGCTSGLQYSGTSSTVKDTGSVGP